MKRQKTVKEEMIKVVFDRLNISSIEEANRVYRMLGNYRNGDEEAFDGEEESNNITLTMECVWDTTHALTAALINIPGHDIRLAVDREAAQQAWYDRMIEETT